MSMAPAAVPNLHGSTEGLLPPAMGAVPLPMATESTFGEGVAIVAGIPQTRDFKFMSQLYKNPYRTLLGVDNRSNAATLLVTVNGRAPAKRVGPGKFVEIEDVVYFYQVDASANTNAGDFTVYENGGLDEAPIATRPTEAQ
jgi:hypothetical protein